MAKVDKEYTVVRVQHRNGSKSEMAGTLAKLVEGYSYTLECGASYSHEKGNKKINKNPKNIASLISNLNNAVNNSAANGYAGVTYSLVEELVPIAE